MKKTNTKKTVKKTRKPLTSSTKTFLKAIGFDDNLDRSITVHYDSIKEKSITVTFKLRGNMIFITPEIREIIKKNQ